jgi:RNA polymerase sigma factor (sigma-70 family)
MATDADLLRESRRRPDAYVEVCRRHAEDISNWLRRQVGINEVDDLLAETFARGWYSRKRFRDPGAGSAGPWLQGIAANVVGDYRRRGAIELRAQRKLGLPPAVPDDMQEDAVERLSVQSEYGAALDAGMGDLPDEQRAALELRVVDELDYEEIGARQAVSPTTARTRVHRALKSLRLNLTGGK